jgi:hypothetical protein
MSVAGGKATKRARLGKITASIARGTVRSAQFCVASGLKYHIVDAEWKMNYLHDDEVTDLLEISDPSITTILTYSTRHSYCERNMRQAWTGASGFEKFGFCLVAGNAAYLDADERRRPLARTICEAAKTVRKNCEDREVWIGTEGVLRLATRLAIEYRLTPFFLLDRSLKPNIQLLKDRGFTGDFAVYVPFYISANRRRVLHDVLYRLSGYMLRRKWVRKEAKRFSYDLSLPMLRSLVQEKRPLSKKLMKSSLGTLLADAAGSLAVFGDPEAVEERLRVIAGLGPKVIVGLPIKESEDQILAFGRCLNAATLRIP